MKKTVFGLLLVVVWLAASCSSSNDYVYALPKEGAVVVSFDLKAMAEKSGMNGPEGEKVVTKLTEVLKSGLEGEAYQAAERLVKQPAESGLSFTDKAYLFVTAHSHASALLAKVNQEGKVKKLLQVLVAEQLCTELKTEYGCTWTQMGDALCAFNASTFLLMQNNKGKAIDLKETMLALMRQEQANSFAGTADFARMEQAAGDIVSVANLSFIPNELTMQLRMGMPAYVKLEDMKFLTAITFEAGRIAMAIEALTTNPEMVAWFDKHAQLLSPLKATYLDAFPAGTTIWMATRLDGKGVYAQLCENPTIRQALENPILPVDMERIFASLQGDLSLGYSSLLSNDWLLYADVTNSEFLRSFEELRPLLALTGGQMKLIDTGKDQYEFRMYGQSIWLGVKDGCFYLSNNERLADEAGRRYGVSLQHTPWASEVTQHRFYLMLNAAQLQKDLQARPRLAYSLGGNPVMVNAVLGACDYLTVGMVDWRKAQLNVVMKEKETNVLKQLVRGLENL